MPKSPTRLGTSEGAVKVAVHRLRQRYREVLRAEIADTVASPGEVEDELAEPVRGFVRLNIRRNLSLVLLQ